MTRQDYYGGFELTPEQGWLEDLAICYILQTELYDRSVCTGPVVEGSVLPWSTRERALITKNAARVWREIMFSVERIGFQERDFRQALGRFDNMVWAVT